MAKRNLMIHKYVRIARATAGYSQVSIAKALGIARQTYIDLETGSTEPRISVLLDICRITNKPLSFFVQADIVESKHGIFITEEYRQRAREHLEEVLRLL